MKYLRLFLLWLDLTRGSTETSVWLCDFGSTFHEKKILRHGFRIWQILATRRPFEVYQLFEAALWHIVKFVGKHPCQSLFLNKVASWGLQFFLKIGSSIGVLLWISRIYRCFPGTSVFLYNTSGPLLRHGCPQWRTLRSEIIFSNWKSFQNDDEKLFRFSSYSSFCLDFLVMYQNGLIKKVRLISNFTRSQPD